MKLIFGIIFLLLTLPSFSQADFHPEGSSMTLQGTSSLHEWESIIMMDQVIVELEILEEAQLKLDHIRLSIPVASIKSGNSIMDRKTYSALRSDTYPLIIYEAGSFDYDGREITASDGKLNVAGNERQIQAQAVFEEEENGQLLTFRGEASFKMTDFDIEPPTAMLGTLKTGNSITLKYTISIKLNH